MPVFTKVLEEEKEIFTGTIVYSYTHKMFEHCVKHLVDERKLVEAKDIEDFKIKCNRYAKIVKYQKEIWPDMIENLVTYLIDFGKNNKNNAEISE